MTLRLRVARLPNGIELPYAEAGDVDGEPVVLLHAYADSWRSFERVFPCLPRSMRAVAPSQRGHGDASKPDAGYAVEDFVGDLGLFLDVLGLERATLVASSSAGFTVRRFLADCPERVAAVVLVGTPWSLRDRAPSLGFLDAVRALEDPVDPAFVRGFVVGTSSDRVPPEFLEVLTAESLKVPAHVWKATLAGLLDAPVPASTARRPALVVWGSADEIVAYGDQERLVDALPGAQLAVYEGAGHAVHWEQPERVAGDVAALVAEIGRR